MKILLLGDYSNVHATLAEGLRALGHYVIVASDGDGWKDYPRDIDLKRWGRVGQGGLWQRLLDSLYYLGLRWLFATKFRGFDVVQIINPVFLPLRAERIMPFYRKLRRHNARVFMGAYGMDYYWVKAGLDCTTFRYSDFNVGSQIRTDIPENELFIRDWCDGAKGTLNREIAIDCDGIPAGLYEYWVSYDRYLPKEERYKLRYIPFPIKCRKQHTNELTHHNQIAKDDNRITDTNSYDPSRPLRFFIGIQKSRSAYKGTDIMLHALQEVEKKYPKLVTVHKAENVPFDEYCRLLDSSDVILDQLYSYTPAMNALQAMSQGMVVVGGAEEEFYELQECYDLRPIVNVQPTFSDVFSQLCQLVEHRDQIPRMKAQSIEFVTRYHDHIHVAKEYLKFWLQGTKERE